MYITSEGPAPAEFEEYRLPVDPAAIHDLLYYANGYVGDSQTMIAMEAGILGTPAIRSNSFADSADVSRTSPPWRRNCGLLQSFGDEQAAVEMTKELVEDPDTQARWEERRQELIDESVDVTDTIVDVVLEAGRDV